MKRITTALVLMFALMYAMPAQADIFGSRPEHRLNASQNQALSFPVDPGTILADLTQITGYLGVREGVFYDFNQGEFCNYAAATVYTVQPYGIAIDVGALNTDGFAVTVDYNLGSMIPAQDVPLLNLVNYLYIGGGAGARDIDGSWKAAYGVDAQFKFTF